MWSVPVGIFVTLVLLAAPAMAHGHERSVNCLFRLEGVQVQLDDLVDGVLVTLTSEDEEVVDRLQKNAWEKMEEDAGAQEHDCLFHMAGAQALVQDVYNGITLTVTSTDANTIAKIQETARWKAKKGCRHDGHHERHH
jgi:hypothetical protein